MVNFLHGLIDVNVGFLQGSILEPLLFSMHINDLINGLPLKLMHFADYASLFL